MCVFGRLIMIKKNAARYQLDPEFRRKLFNLALERGGSMAQMGKRLGYKGKWKGKRFKELGDGVIKTIALHQLKELSEITSIPLEEVHRHATPIRAQSRKRERKINNTKLE